MAQASGAPSTQDAANVALGIICFASTFLLGKIVVNAIIEGRKEHFSRKGQPAPAVKAKESTFDGVMKLAATGYSIWRLQQDLPDVLAAIKKLSP